MLELPSRCHLTVPDPMSNIARNMNLEPTIPPKSGQIMPRLPRISRDLDTAAGWLRELGAIYRCARRNQMPTEDASRLAFLCSAAGKLAKDVEQLRQLEAMGRQLDELQQRPPLTPYASYGADVIEQPEAQQP